MVDVRRQRDRFNADYDIGTNTSATPRERTICEERGRQAREGAGIQAQANPQSAHLDELGWYVSNGRIY